VSLNLSGRRILVTGVINRHSIAFAVAERAQQQGAEVLLTGFGRSKRMTERAAARLSGPPAVIELDATSPADFAALEDRVAQHWDRVDGVLHAIAFAPEDALGGNFLATPVESAELAFRTSAFSFKELAASLSPLMPPGASVVGLDFDASVAWPVYDWMGVSKAALESVCRYLARDLGPLGVRANLISAGPIETAAASGIEGFDDLASAWPERAPLGWDSEDPLPVADAACFLLSELSRGVSGEILHVDGGYHAIGAGSAAAMASALVQTA
jgi:meromycolic acid enoyl-[acyl-carrier-protein] reductase